MLVDILRGERLKGLASEAINFISSISHDEPLIKPVIMINQAHMIMLIECGLVKRECGIECLKVLESIPLDLKLDPKLEDVHMNIESFVIKKLGEEIGGQLNLGKSRNDQVATAIRMVLRDYVLNINSNLINLCKTLIQRCEEHLETIMPGYTHLQHAQPVTLAHHLLAYCEALIRDGYRLKEAYNRINMSPMGAAALATTGLNIDRNLVASLLGFDGLIRNSIDAVSSRDFAVEVISNLSLLMMNLSRMAEELILWSTYEFGIVEIPDEYASTSSIMPQKKNAVVAEMIRSKTSIIYGDLFTSLSILKSLPYSYNLDLQDLTPKLWDACNIALTSLIVMDGMMKGVKFNVNRLKDLMKNDMLLATDLADYLTQKFGISFRIAHRIIGALVKKAIENGKTLNDVVSDLSKFIEEIAGLKIKVPIDELKDVLNVRRAIEIRKVIGGPSPFEVIKMINYYKSEINNLENWISECKSKLEKSFTLLHNKIASLKGVGS